MTDEQTNTLQTTTKRGPGKPRTWATPEALQEVIDRYFADPDPVKTVSGLCIAMDCHRSTLLRYGRRDEYSNVVTRARDRIMEYYERYGQTGRNSNFADRMQTRMGWPAIERQEIDTGEGLQGLLDWVQQQAALPASEPSQLPGVVEGIVVDSERDLHTMQAARNPHYQVNNEDSDTTGDDEA